MGRYPDRKSASIPALWAVQRLYGWCTPEGIRQAAAVMRVTPAYLESVASFYDLLHTEPVGTHKVAVCTNISCWMRGGDELLDAFRAAAEGDEDVFVTGFECLGACDIAPMASIDERYFGPLDAAEAATAIEQLRAGAGGAAREGAGEAAAGGRLRCLRRASCSSTPRTRSCARSTATRATAATRRWRRPTARWRPTRSSRSSKTRACAGAAAPASRWAKRPPSCPAAEMDKYLCCNADESEPGAFKDRELMQRNPHQLIEGIAIAAIAADAGHAFIFIRGEYDPQADILDAAVAEAYEAGYLGKDILGSHRDLELVVHRGAGAYICGEETALLDALEGKRGNPRLKPPFPAVQGLYGGPTLINNVETLSNVPQIVANGAEWFQGFGTEQSPGTKVVSVSGCVRRPGNYEVELGIPTRELIYDLAGGPRRGSRGQGLLPGRLLLPGPHRRGRARPALQLRGDGRGRLDARLGLDHRRRRHASRSRTWRCARRASTTTSPAASAPPAARGPTGR